MSADRSVVHSVDHLVDYLVGDWDDYLAVCWAVKMADLMVDCSVEHLEHRSAGLMADQKAEWMAVHWADQKVVQMVAMKAASKAALKVASLADQLENSMVVPKVEHSVVLLAGKMADQMVVLSAVPKVERMELMWVDPKVVMLVD